MAIVNIITANCENNQLSQQMVSRQWDDKGTLIQFAGYPEPEGDEALIFRLIVWMKESEDAEPRELPPILLDSDQWLISNYYTQLVQTIKFQLCITNETGTYEKHSPVFAGHIGRSLSHNGQEGDIDVIPLFDPYMNYVDEKVNELIVAAGDVQIDASLRTSGAAADAKATGDKFIEVNGRLTDLELDVFGESKTVFTSETWQATAGLAVATANHPCAVDIPANTEFVIEVVAPEGIFNENKINFYAYNENLERVDKFYDKPVNTEFALTSANHLKRINIYVSEANVIGSGSFYFTVSIVETKSDSLKTQVDETASKADAIADKFVESKNIAGDIEWIVGGFVSGEIRPSQTDHITHEAYISVESNTYYTMSWETTGAQYIFFGFYDNQKSYISATTSTSTGSGKTTVLTPNGTAYMKTCLWKSGETFENLIPTKFQVEKGQEATSYSAPTILGPDSVDVKAVYDKMAEDGLFDTKVSVPDYYYANSYLDNKISRINTLASGCAATGDSFIFITDEHWEKNQKQSIPLISTINESCHIDKVISGGDTADSPSEDFCNKLRKAFPHRIYHVAGNHDWFPEDGNLMYYYMDAYNVDQIGNPENHYYYVDNPQKKIRYIVLNRYKKANNEWINMNNDSEQVSWLTNEALNVESGWSVLVFVHFISASESVTLVLDNAKNNGIDVIAIIAGHTHYDAVRHTNGGIPMIFTTCDKNSAWIKDGVDQEPWLTEDRSSGTIYEQAFDVFVVDRENKTITAVRIGMPAMDNTDVDKSSPDFVYHGTLEERVITYT